MTVSLARSLLSSTFAQTSRSQRHTPIPILKQTPPLQASWLAAYSHRHISSSSPLNYPRKDTQDKDEINTEASEYSKSGTDDDSARQENAAFDPDITDPQEQHEKAGEGGGEKSNPLEVSPANPEVSKQRPQQEGGAQNSGDNESRQRSSGGSSPSKGSKVT